MSRCFPFPPPGYEKEHTRPEEGDLLKEEKRKEKKHKKEKKDKEKREGKEKRDKDRGDEKHREKKEKKDKHRDKKEKHKDKKKDKEKEKDKDKEKSSISEEARVAFISGASSGVSAHETDQQKDRQTSSEKGRDEHKDGQTSSEKGRDEHKDRQTSSEKGRDDLKDRHISSEKAKYPNQFHVQHGEKPFKTSLFPLEADDSKFVQELGRRIRDEGRGAQSQLAERSPVEWKQTGRVVIKDSGNLSADQEKNKEKRVDNSKMDGNGFPGELKIGANAMRHCLSTMAKSKSEGIPRPLDTNKMDGQESRDELKFGANAIPPSPFTTASKFEGTPRPLEENLEKKREEKEKPKERRDDKPREKHKDKEREKKSHGKQKDKEKEKKKEEKAKDKSERKKSKEDKSRDINKNDFVGLSNNKLPLVAKENIAGTVTEGIIRKRKDVETNGFLHESEVRPAKLPRPSSSQQPIQNGKKLDAHPKEDLFSSNKQGVATDIKVQIEEHKMNGSIAGQPLSSTKAKAPSMIPGADQIAEAPKRPPHPDSKYLSQILSVPMMDDWSGFDDQEWLLGSERTLKKAETCPDEVNKEHRVWSEGLQLDSADIFALPYVIPY